MNNHDTSVYLEYSATAQEGIFSWVGKVILRVRLLARVTHANILNGLRVGNHGCAAHDVPAALEGWSTSHRCDDAKLVEYSTGTYVLITLSYRYNVRIFVDVGAIVLQCCGTDA